MELILGMKECNPSLEIMLIIPKNGIIESELIRKNIPYKVIEHYNWFYNKAFGDKWKKKSFILFKFWLLRNKWRKLFENKLAIKKHLNYVSQFCPDFIYVNSSLNPMGLTVAKELGIKNVWHHRETLNDNVYGFYLENRKKFLKYYRSADLHFFPSQFLEKNYLNEFGKVKSKVVYNSVLLDSETFSDRRLHKPIRFGIVGRINDQKNQKEIIELFKTAEIKELNFELHIIGHGDQDFQKWLRKQNVANIVFHDFLDRREIYKKFDFLISNARYEAFGRTVAEANFAGVPVIVRASGAFSEIVENRANGYLYQNMRELIVIIKDISYMREADYKKMSKQCRKMAGTNYDYEKLAKKVMRELDFLNYHGE
ncbi:glycosyltransferase family 4 protein [Autumnicola psychrophila]|uniref:Glycosyltransferase family 4 protein n=1 Tax=Autumnicola psychrophila TaxID=3075592 RepID=A0ABU3DUR2_9FLAO|nr:glycosyltransferase family 4 protein [Zunongwangia sp. F225]MDT0687445.1 glycosyltransferase family 4 protein [Zunongwangia sp. F225]